MKKTALFVSNQLRKKLERSTDWSKAYRVAIEFYAQLVIYGSSRYDAGVWGFEAAPRHSGSGGGYAKFFCGCHTESQHTKALFQDSQRVEAHIGLFGRELRLELKGYKLGEKTPFDTRVWYFPKTNPYHRVVNPRAE